MNPSPGPESGPPRKKSATRWIIAVVVVIVLAVAGGGAWVVMGPRDPADRAAEGYLNALKAGDAGKALSFCSSTDAASQRLMNDKVLSAQRALGMGLVSFDRRAPGLYVVQAGSSVDTWLLPAHHEAGGWKVACAASLRATSPTKLFGETIGEGETVALFPGQYEVRPRTSTPCSPAPSRRRSRRS
ncbi:hypothetical protein [Mariniluteicoccus flavus]